MTEAAGSGGLQAPDFLGAKKLEDGIGLCLSGGGFRAMLFHLGALSRLNDAGLLQRIDRIASVSGGSLAAGALASAWSKLDFDDAGRARNFNAAVGAPILQLAQRYVDVPAILRGIPRWFGAPAPRAAERTARVYDRDLCRGATLQDLPDHPRFTFIATSFQTGTIWRFSKPYAANYRVGNWRTPEVPVATVVAASAAFPPFLSPLTIKPPVGAITDLPGADLGDAEHRRELVLTDGGVYDNLGLETVWKRYRTILVSDGGTLLPTPPVVASWWGRQALRANAMGLQQGISLRLRVLAGLHALGQRTVVFWSLNDTGLFARAGDGPAVEPGEMEAANAASYRLKRHAFQCQNQLLRAGFAAADRAVRATPVGRDLDIGDVSTLPKAKRSWRDNPLGWRP